MMVTQIVETVTVTVKSPGLAMLVFIASFALALRNLTARINALKHDFIFNRCRLYAHDIELRKKSRFIEDTLSLAQSVLKESIWPLCLK